MIGEDQWHMFDSLIGYARSPTLRQIRSALHHHGLHVITTAEKAVLDAMSRVEIQSVRSAGIVDHYITWDGNSKDLARAELARRENKP